MSSTQGFCKSQVEPLCWGLVASLWTVKIWSELLMSFFIHSNIWNKEADCNLIFHGTVICTPKTDDMRKTKLKYRSSILKRNCGPLTKTPPQSLPNDGPEENAVLGTEVWWDLFMEKQPPCKYHSSQHLTIYTHYIHKYSFEPYLYVEFV
jgi:hypothetical protein